MEKLPDRMTISKDDVLLRGAKSEDVDAMVRVLIGSFPDKFAAIFGKKTKEGARALAEYCALRKDLEGIFVVEVDMNIAGVIGLSAKEMKKREQCSLKLFLLTLVFSFC
jgi:hypothetical protein